MKTGILGGTFDPVHRGHLAIAREVTEKLHLDRVLFVPAGQPWMKAERKITAAPKRTEMVRLAIASEARFQLSTMEVERPGPTYTIDTLVELKKRGGKEDELYFIVGWGSLEQMESWREPARIVELCYIVVVPRPGYTAPAVSNLEARIPGLSRRVILLDAPRLDISSTEIRERIRKGCGISDLVPEAVERYIRKHSLYLDS